MTNTPLRAMFWKECRENLRWAILAMLALTLGLIYAWYHLLQQDSYLTLSQVWTSENLVLTISMPLIGLTLGLLQILPELRRDQWAFLVHHPASQTTLFFGKVLPGVCLYLLATVLPLLGLAAWAAQPIHVPAPFDFRFTLAGWAAILAGLPFYFAGLLVALRPARWYGSRALPVLTAILAPLAASTFNQFWPVVLVSVFISAVLLCAAWGSFVTSGEYKAQTKPARFALGLTLYPATIVAVIGTLLIAASIGNSIFRNRIVYFEYSDVEYQLDNTGQVYRVIAHHDRLGHEHDIVSDLTGKPTNARVWENLNRYGKVLNWGFLPQGEGSNQIYSRYSDPSCYVLSLDETRDDTHQTDWYYETRTHQIVAYSFRKVEGYPIAPQMPSISGYLGPDGFGRNREQAGQFQEASPLATVRYGVHLIQFPRSIYWYTPSAHIPEARLLQSLPCDGDITFLSQPEVLVITAGNQLTVYRSSSPDGSLPPKKLFTTFIKFAPSNYSGTMVAALPDQSRFFFLSRAATPSASNQIITVASDGRLVSDQTLPAGAGMNASQKIPFMNAAPMLAIPPAILGTMIGYGYIGDRLHWGSASGLWDTTVEDTGPILFFSGLGGFASGVLVWLISRRCGDNRRGQIAWALGGFWLGGYGVLLLLALRAWPARLPCPDCGRLRVVDNDFCEHCRAGWTRPQRDGTEIFDADRREAAAQ